MGEQCRPHVLGRCRPCGTCPATNGRGPCYLTAVVVAVVGGRALPPLRSHPRSCHLGTTRTLRMLEPFYWWIGMNVCTRWWLRHCLKCQARKTPWLTVRWPIISMPLPEGSGVAVSVDSFGPFRSHHEATTTSCCSPIASVVGPTCSPSLPLSPPRRVQPISW